MELLAEFDLELMHGHGKHNGNADAMSGRPYKHVNDSKESSISFPLNFVIRLSNRNLKTLCVALVSVKDMVSYGNDREEAQGNCFRTLNIERSGRLF